MRNRISVTAVALTTMFLAACGATGTPVDPAPVNSLEQPRPAGVAENPTTTSGTAAAAPTCPEDGRASFRPNGPLPPPGQMPNGSTMQKIQQYGRLKAGVDQNTFLFGSRNSKTGQLEGFDIDRVREIAAAIFGDPDKVQYVPISQSSDRIPFLKDGKVDVVVRTFTANCTRWADINFSAIYYVASQKLLVEKTSQVTGLKQLGGKRVCTQTGATSFSTLTKADPKVVVVAVKSWSDCLIMFQQGQVDAVATDDAILAGMAAQDPNVKLISDRVIEEPYGIGIPKQNEDMVRFVNGVLEKSVRDGKWAESYNRWLRPSTGVDASPPVPEYYR